MTTLTNPNVQQTPDAHRYIQPEKSPIPTLSDETLTQSIPHSATQTIRTTCAYCGVGCGVVARVHHDDANSESASHPQPELEAGISPRLTVAGDPEHPANFGKLCSKGSALGDTLDTDRRLTHPMVNNQTVTMNEALNYVADGLKQCIDEYGSDSVMLYVSGQLLTEDYYVANKFAKGFLGTNNIDSNSRLCMSSAVAGYKRAFGSDTVPCSYYDIEDSDLFVIIGSNMAWCHPILFGRLKASKADNSYKKVVVIDPRETDSCQIADLHLPIKGGTDTHLLNGLLRFLHHNGHGDTDYLAYCEGVDEAIKTSQDWTPERVADVCGVPVADVLTFYHWFADTAKTVSFYSMGVNQSSRGTDKVNAIINAHLYTGKIGYAGAGAFSITGQPNAMGGREVGALANLLASHLDLDNAEHRQMVADFWQTPVSVTGGINASHGVKSADVADAILSGKIKAIWIMATNPIVSLPEADKFAKALEACDLVVVSDCSKDSDTLAYATVALPAQGWSEKSGTVTNSERCISRQRRLVRPIGEAMPDWWLVSQVAQRMGFDEFNYTHEHQIFVEHARLSGFANESSSASAISRKIVPRSFDISQLASLSQAEYDELTPFQWGERHYFSANQLQKGQVYTPNGQARLIPIIPELPQSHANTDYPLILNTGRLRDQWHTMTRTGMASQLNQHLPQPFVAMHPDDAQTFGLKEGDFTLVSSGHGSVVARCQVTTRQRLGDVFMPMHWNDHFTSNARVGKLITAHVDPISQQPESKYTPVTVKPMSMAGFAKLLIPHQVDDTVLHGLQNEMPMNNISRFFIATPSSLHPTFWVRNRQILSSDYFFAFAKDKVSSAGNDDNEVKSGSPVWLEVTAWQTQLLNWLSKSTGSSDLAIDEQTMQVLYYLDAERQQLRMAVVAENPNLVETDNAHTKLLAVLFVSVDEDTLPNHAWLDTQFDEPLTAQTRKWLLMGKPATGFVDVGRIVCSCMTVGENTIIDTIQTHGCTTASEVGKHCKAGTNCGSCISEINALIAVVHEERDEPETV